MMSDTLYKKVGKRYVEVGSDTRLHCDGVWLVYRTRTGKRQSCVLITDKMPDIPMIAYHSMQSEITDLIMSGQKQGMSANYLADEICRCFARAATPGYDNAE